MATTKNQYTGDGSTVLFPFTFPYIEESDVVVSVDDVVQTIITEYIFSNATTIGFTSAPADGAVVLIKRVTSADNLKATFFPGSAIRARDLNDNFTQNLYVTQESEINAGDATEAARIATEAALQAQNDAAEAKEDAAAAAEDAQAAADGVAGAAQDAADAQAAATAAQTAAGEAQTAATQAAADAQTAVDAVDEILEAVEDGAVVSVNGQGGVVSLGIGDMTDVETASEGHVPSDGDALVWNEIHGHWMPGDSASNIVDQGDFAYQPTSNTAALGGPAVTGTPTGSEFLPNRLGPNGYAFFSFEQGPNAAFISALSGLEQGDQIDLTWNNAGNLRTDRVGFQALESYTEAIGLSHVRLVVQSTLGTFGFGAWELTVGSPKIVNGIEPLHTGDILKYDTATGKWTASPSISIGTLPTLP